MSLIPAGTDSVSGLFKSAAQSGDVLATTSMPALTGDVTTSAGAVATTLATVNSNVGAFTSANITVNGKGLITAAANGTGGGSGTVTSVTFTGDGTVLSSTPSSAVTTTGTLTASLNTQTANKVLAGPTSGSAANPTFRSLVVADFPTVNSNVGSFTNANITVDAQGLVTAAANGTATAGGSSGQVLYNNAGSQAGVTGITLSSGTLSTISFANIYQINNAMQMFDGASTKAADVPARRLWDNAGTGLSIDWNSRIGVNSAGSTMLDWSSTSGIQTTKFFKYNTVPLQGNGLISIPGWGPRVVGATAAQTLATFLPTADGSFYVSANLLVTTATLFSVSVTCTYTDEGGTNRTATLSFSQLTGTILNLITNTQGAGPYEGIPLHIRVKGNTAITIQTAGTFTTVTYNGEGSISQIA